MSYTHERDEFISRATAEGLSLDTCRKLLRYATMLHRLAEAQCNGDWPYNGDRDRPAINEFTGDIVRLKWDERYTTCPKCEAPGVAKSVMRWSYNTKPRYGRTVDTLLICPDCRTQELIMQALWPKGSTRNMNIIPIFQGDPRGAVLRLATPKYPWSADGWLGRGLYVPARVR